ncbi:hypothetical protein BB560_002804 [Smittium megazygosporum]|uniref:Uncharacterized protein n=1 Tax=Smittium megazygosporum TaxID=133381 RepID=A0A2T9ZDT3_9FUNG|nr:hypothetical protein BB560_002804 [Smittium megazygosporum]
MENVKNNFCFLFEPIFYGAKALGIHIPNEKASSSLVLENTNLLFANEIASFNNQPSICDFIELATPFYKPKKEIVQCVSSKTSAYSQIPPLKQKPNLNLVQLETGLSFLGISNTQPASTILGP